MSDMLDKMTLRDYFAAKVMQGICASDPVSTMTNERIAAESYDLADAMLEARNIKEKENGN